MPSPLGRVVEHQRNRERFFTSSVTAYAVTPSPQGEGLEAAAPE